MGLSFTQMRVMTNIPDKKLSAYLQKLLAKQEIIQTDKEKQIYVSGSFFNNFKEKIIEKLADYHKQNPLKEGMPTQELKSKFQYITDTRFFNILFTKLAKEQLIIQDKDIIKLAGHKIALQVDQHAIKDKILSIYKESGLTPPFFRTICRDLEIDKKTANDVLYMLLNEQAIIKTKDDLNFDKTAIDNLEAKLITFLKQNESITTPQFKEMTKVSRKFVIPLIEYFDSTNRTIRVGDTRQLRRKD